MGTARVVSIKLDSIRLEDLPDLYGALSKRLEQIVRIDVAAPEPVVEDACQIAWGRLIDSRRRVRREAALSWLARTAVHEAFRLLRRDDRELSLEALELSLEALDATVEQPSCPASLPMSPPPDELFQQRERLAELRSLPERQQRLLWLHALGLSYNEMALHEGYTTRTVERQLLRAKRRIRERQEA